MNINNIHAEPAGRQHSLIIPSAHIASAVFLALCYLLFCLCFIPPRGYIPWLNADLQSLLYRFYYLGLPVLFPVGAPYLPHALVGRFRGGPTPPSRPAGALLPLLCGVLLCAAAVSFERFVRLFPIRALESPEAWELFYLLSPGHLLYPALFYASALAVSLAWAACAPSSGGRVRAGDFLFSGMLYTSYLQIILQHTLMDQTSVLPRFRLTFLPLGVGLAAAVVCGIRCKKRPTPDRAKT